MITLDNGSRTSPYKGDWRDIYMTANGVIICQREDDNTRIDRRSPIHRGHPDWSEHREEGEHKERHQEEHCAEVDEETVFSQ